MAETLVILGASARAAAFSARRAGFRPVCGDLFADADLQTCCPAVAISDYPWALERVAQEAPPAAWIYTGGLENYPRLVERICRTRPLLGVGPVELNRVRDPLLVAETLRAAGLPCPACRTTPSGLPTDGSWLLKGRRSSGGGQVFVWHGQHNARSDDSPWYFQQRVEGLACAALYVAAAGRAELLGVTEQMLAGGGRAVRPFCYAGSLGPLPLSPLQAAGFARLGEALAAEFRLTGLFGVDAVLTEEGVWPVEINPRYAASAEIIERATALSAIALHVAACREHALPALPAAPSSADWHGKTILYARQAAVVGAELAAEWLERSQAEQWPAVADVPAAGSPIRAGQPVVTLFAKAGDRRSLGDALSEQEAYWQRRLGALS